MSEIQASGSAGVRLLATATVDARYSFGPQFLAGAAYFARQARELEQLGEAANEKARSHHVAYVVAAVMQSVASLESQIVEVTMHGPSCHLGSSGLNSDALTFLEPLATSIDKMEVITRFDVVLHLLKKPRLDRGVQLWSDSTLLVALRNELVHYKSKWGGEMEPPDGRPLRLIDRLQQLRHQRPPWVAASPATNFFPHQCLSADCAVWAVNAAVKLIDEFYLGLDVASPLDGHRPRLSTLASSDSRQSA